MLKRLSLRAKVVAGAVVILVLGAAPAWAYWSAQQNAPAQTFNVGHLDLTAAQSGTVSLDTTLLYPGASVAEVYQVSNAGSLPLSFFARGWASGSLGANLAIKVTNAGTVTGTFPSATCGGTQVPPNATAVPTASPGAPIAFSSPAASRTPLQPSTGPNAGTPSTTTICVQASLPTNAPNALQSQSTTVNVQFLGEQVGQP